MNHIKLPVTQQVGGWVGEGGDGGMRVMCRAERRRDM